MVRGDSFRMRCTNCGTELIAGKQFCHACGARAALTCPNCSATVAAGFRFCPDCGFQLGAAPGDAPQAGSNSPLTRLSQQIPDELAQKIRASRESMEGERKQVTVLFCDLAGSTAIAEHLDPEEYHDLLEQYLELAFREIYRCEGIVNQLAGDGLMALFGAPISHEDAPHRAVRAALAIQQALDGFNEQHTADRGVELRARIGIHTGPVVVGTVGNDLKMDYTAIGDTTNLASRLESLAKPGTILVSEATWRLLRGLCQVRRAGPFAVKGKSEPVSAYEILGFSAGLSEGASPMAIAVERGLTPLVGRVAELAQIEACYHRLSADLPQLVAVVGDPGSGKSRLLYEFKERLAGEPTVWFEARCSAWNQMVPYYPFTFMLKRHFDLAADEPAERARDKIARKVRAWDERLDQLFPFLCHMLSVPSEGTPQLSEDEIKQETFRAVAHVVIGESRRAPVVMMIEDLHWIDEPSREMLEAAVAELAMAPVMLLVSHRPDYRPAWRTHAAFTQLSLRRLADPHIRQIILALAGGSLPIELERLILTKAEGSPFLAEEITRSLMEEGDLARNGKGHKLTRPVEEIRIPGTVQGVIAARLDRLGPAAKRVVQFAAVLGRQFARDQLVQLLANEDIDVDRELEELELRGVIHRKNLFTKDEYRFGESLTQEVAYEGLLLKQRRQLHERIALLIEASPGEAGAERSGLLAHHFRLSDNRVKTIEALLRAARDAERVPSYRTAAQLYREAWDTAEPGFGDAAAESLHRMALQAVIGACRMAVIYNTSAPPDTEHVVIQAREIADRLGDTATIGSLLTYHGMLMMAGGRQRFGEGLALVEQGLALVQHAGLTQAAVGISRGLAWSYLLDGRFALAQRTIDWVAQELERAGERDRLSDVYLGSRYLLERIRYYSGDLDGALSCALETYQLGVAASNRTVQGGSAGILAQARFVQAEYAEAKQWAERSLEMTRAVSNVSACRIAAAIALLARAELAEPGPAPQDLETWVRAVTSDDGDVAIGSHVVVDALLALGDLEGAERFARVAHERGSGRLREMLSAAALGEVLLRLGPDCWGEAERCYNQAAALAEALGAPATLATARLGIGEVTAARGDHGASRHQLQQALALCRELGLAHYQARAERLLAAVAGREPAHAQASGA
jgi:class 3 adenylate cyclase